MSNRSRLVLELFRSAVSKIGPRDDDKKWQICEKTQSFFAGTKTQLMISSGLRRIDGLSEGSSGRGAARRKTNISFQLLERILVQAPFWTCTFRTEIMLVNLWASFKVKHDRVSNLFPNLLKMLTLCDQNSRISLGTLARLKGMSAGIPTTPLRSPNPGVDLISQCSVAQNRWKTTFPSSRWNYDVLPRKFENGRVA